MKVLMINGSPHAKGCTFTALSEIAEELAQSGVDSEIIQVKDPVRDCIACGKCTGADNRCIFDDDIVNEIIEKAKTADAFVFGTPVYYAHPCGRILSAMDRMFYAGGSVFRHKPAAAVASARRAGTTASFDVLNKYFTINQMPIVSSTYWNMVHGVNAEDVKQDFEGLQTMRNIAANMIWLLKSIEAGREKGLKPPESPKVATNFIR